VVVFFLFATVLISSLTIFSPLSAAAATNCPDAGTVLTVSKPISSSLLSYSTTEKGSNVNYTLNTSNQTPAGGIPGVAALCIYPGSPPGNSFASVTGESPIFPTWTASTEDNHVLFLRPGSFNTNIPLDGSSRLVGTVSYSSVLSTETVVARLDWPSECATLFGSTDSFSTSISCFVILSLTSSTTSSSSSSTTSSTSTSSTTSTSSSASSSTKTVGTPEFPVAGGLGFALIAALAVSFLLVIRKWSFPRSL